MKHLKSYEIRQMWLDFFKEKGHEVISSASLIPANDPTLLWINAGIAPLKKFFDGREIPNNKRMVNAQKSLRTNDIDNVGKTARHHTFFEMLGNFSIGDYFRKEALTWAIEILTSPKWFGFDLNKLYFTIYPDDKESFEIWKSLGVLESHIIPLEGNFWEIGEGPCGPDSEIFYDRGEKYDPSNLGIKLLTDEIENDRYIEIWNIVFSQFNAKTDLERINYPELPSKNIDTGMGLERMACIMQEVETNYETDLFMPIIKEIEKLSNITYKSQMAFKVISDHIRTITFALSDGAMLSNEGRGYVLRRILRRALRYGKSLGLNEPFLYKLVEVVCNNMKSFYPYLEDNIEIVSKVVLIEEEKFLQTLETGEKKLIDFIQNSKTNVIPSSFAFLLYDTFGFPIELTIEASLEYGFSVDLDGFYEELKKQKELAKSSRVDLASLNSQNEDMLNFKENSHFVGYDNLEVESKVIGIFKDGSIVNSGSGELTLVFEKTPFYATSGGQVHDEGEVILNNLVYPIKDCFKMPNDQHALTITTKEFIHLNDICLLKVNPITRLNISKNHSATHLLNESIRKVLGSHVHQLSSYVSGEYLRFDFNNFTFPTFEQLLEIEKLVNQEINKKSQVIIEEKPLQLALEDGVQALFGEKYKENVRVCTIGFSKELCGGTHVDNTLQIEKFCIFSCENKGSGVFRIEARTGSNLKESVEKELVLVLEDIKELLEKKEDLIKTASLENIVLNNQEISLKEITPSYESIVTKKNELNILKENLKELDKLYQKQKRNKLSVSIESFLDEVVVINNTKTLIFKVNDIQTNQFKDLIDRLVDYLGDCVVLGCLVNSSIMFICKSKSSINASLLIKEVSKLTSGSGGGRSDFAQAGGKDFSKVFEALEFAKNYLKENL